MTKVLKDFGENFELVYVTGKDMDDIPYEDLEVRSKGLAKKHVIDIRLDRVHNYTDNGKPVKHSFKGVEVAHGMRCQCDTLAETKEYIDTLSEALDVAFEVQKYCILNGWWS